MNKRGQGECAKGDDKEIDVNEWDRVKKRDANVRDRVRVR